MTIDLSSLNSILNTVNYSGGATTKAAQPTANFEDYLMNALNASKTNEKTSTNGLYDLISNSGNVSVMNGLMNSNNGVNAITSYDLYTSLTGGANSTTSNSKSDVFSDFLQSSFQSTMMKNMNVAKAKLQMSYEDFVAKVGNSPDEAAKIRMNQMKQNIETVGNFISTKNASTNTLEQVTNSNGTVSATDLLSQLQGNNSSFNGLVNEKNQSSSQNLLNQLTISGNYFGNKINS